MSKPTKADVQKALRAAIAGLREAGRKVTIGSEDDAEHTIEIAARLALSAQRLLIERRQAR